MHKFANNDGHGTGVAFLELIQHLLVKNPNKPYQDTVVQKVSSWCQCDETDTRTK